MATRGRFGHGARSAASGRRKTAWLQGPRGQAINIVMEASILFATGIQALLPGLTLVRVRGEMTYGADRSGGSAGTTSGFGRTASGICIVSENAFGIGVTAMPDALTDIGWDGWLWHSIGSTWSAQEFVQPSNQGPGSSRVVIDNKAMRKWKETDIMVGLFATDDSFGTGPGIRAVMDTRLLVKLP